MHLPSIVEQNSTSKISIPRKFNQPILKHSSLQFSLPCQKPKKQKKHISISYIPKQIQTSRCLQKHSFQQTSFKSEEYVPTYSWKPNKMKQQNYQTLDKWKGKYFIPKSTLTRFSLDLSSEKIQKKEDCILKRRVMSKSQPRGGITQKQQDFTTNLDNKNTISKAPSDFCDELAVTKVNVQKTSPHTIYILNKKNKLKSQYGHPNFEKTKMKQSIYTDRVIGRNKQIFNYISEKFTIQNPSQWNVDNEQFENNTDMIPEY